MGRRRNICFRQSRGAQSMAVQNEAFRENMRREAKKRRKQKQNCSKATLLYIRIPSDGRRVKHDAHGLADGGCGQVVAELCLDDAGVSVGCDDLAPHDAVAGLCAGGRLLLGGRLVDVRDSLADVEGRLLARVDALDQEARLLHVLVLQVALVADVDRLAVQPPLLGSHGGGGFGNGGAGIQSTSEEGRLTTDASGTSSRHKPTSLTVATTLTKQNQVFET